MPYTIKEIVYTLQGEGAQAGRPAVFCRFSGCNLWSGRERDRLFAICRFCDTDFIGTDGRGGGQFQTAKELADAVANCWGDRNRLAQPYVVFTGGEPLLQLDQDTVNAIHDRGFEIAIETNGTVVPPRGIDWLCCSPKAGTQLAIRSGDELKLVFPQPELHPSNFEHLDFKFLYLQPMDGPDRSRNVKLSVDYCLENPRWHLSLQLHKMLGIP